MVSSTYTDLKEHRKELITLIQTNRLLPIDMEHHGGARADLHVLESSLQMVRDSAAYVCIISHRYGQIPPARNPGRLSITELEFNEALRLQRPILLFLMGDDHPVKVGDIERDSVRLAKLAAFRERAKRWQGGGGIGRVYQEFNSVEEFRIAAATAIPRLKAAIETEPMEGGAPVQNARDERLLGSAGRLARLPRLELLCDRADADTGLAQALLERPDRRRPGCLILFGESDQGHAAFLERMIERTLPLYEEHYANRDACPVYLDYRGERAKDVALQIFGQGSSYLRVPATTAIGLYAAVKKRNLDLFVLYCSVNVDTHGEARYWISCFEMILGMFELEPDGAQIGLVLSLSYSRGFWLLRRERDLTRFFMNAYPDEYPGTRRGAGAVDPIPGVTVRRLSSVRAQHVGGWCAHPEVQAYINDIDVVRKSLLALFRSDRELPMQTVLEQLKETIRRYSNSGRGLAR
jgi:hypothetical protein